MISNWAAVVCFLFFIASYDHELYVSVIEINGDQSQGSLVVKTFSDDIETALQNLKLETGQRDIETYVNRTIDLTVNDVNVQFVLENSKEEGLTKWFYFSFDHPRNWKGAVIKTTFLMEIFADQTNILKVVRNKKSHYNRLNIKKKVSNFTFVEP